MKKILFENGKTIDGANTFNTMQDNVEEVFNGEEAMGSIVVEDITCKNIADIEDVKVNGSEEINRKIYNVKPNTEYTLSYTKSRISGVTITQATIWGIRKITFYDKNGTQLSTLAGTTISLPENSSKKCALTFTTPANTSYVECRLDNNNGDSNVNTLVSNVQLEKGPVATDHVEHRDFFNSKILFDGSSTGNVNLKDSKSNYFKLEIYYTVLGRKGSVTILSTDTTFNLSNILSAPGYFTASSAAYDVSEKELTLVSNRTYSNTATTSGSITQSNNNDFTINKVIGYKK